MIRIAKTREYLPSELDWEYQVEYLKYARPSFPGAFASREDFQAQYDAAPLVILTHDELCHLEYSMAYRGKGRGEAWVHQTFAHRRDTRRIIDALRSGETAPPIVLKVDGRLRLMAGQTRLAAGLALGIEVPVKVIEIKIDWSQISELLSSARAS